MRHSVAVRTQAQTQLVISATVHLARRDCSAVASTSGADSRFWRAEMASQSRRLKSSHFMLLVMVLVGMDMCLHELILVVAVPM